MIHQKPKQIPIRYNDRQVYFLNSKFYTREKSELSNDLKEFREIKYITEQMNSYLNGQF